MRRRVFLLAGIAAMAVLAAGVALGSTPVTFEALFRKGDGGGQATAAILWQLRLPRVLLAFLAGGAFALGGAVFQSLLKNALASPYILGISAGASLGTALVMLTGFALPLIGAFTLPAAGFVFGLGTVVVVLGFAAKLDSALSSNTVILFGMVFSLFVNAILTVTVALFHEELKTLVLWQMGSFALKGWPYLRLLVPFAAAGAIGVFREHRALDLLSFSDDEAASMGVETRIVRPRLFFLAALLTGATVALCGAIGFVDLIAPHLARRLVGPCHRYALPLSFLLGGTLLVASDLAARCVISPSELPVGAVTALLGAPFFVALYFRRRYP